jgi:DNA-binding CsgD family transcriptional regulator
MDETMLTNKPAERSPLERAWLTPREREVLTWVANGKSAWEIGAILAIAKRTVDEHVQNVIRKLGAANRTQATAIAVRNRLIEVDYPAATVAQESQRVH